MDVRRTRQHRSLARSGLPRCGGIWALAVLLAACGSSTLPASVTSEPAPSASPAASTTPSTEVSPTGAGRVLHYVALGDSWVAGGHCGGCRTFADRWIPGLEAATGATIQYTNFTGAHEPGVNGGGDSRTLIRNIRNDPGIRAAVRAADVILISTGGNDLQLVADPLLAGSCGGQDGAACARDLGKTWATNFDAILAEVDTLRSGNPTVIRLVDSANAFVSDTSMTVGLPAGFATGNGALIFQLLNDAMCAAAAKHAAVCIDVRPILNGPSMIEPVDENSDASMQEVADALIASGVAELN